MASKSSTKSQSKSSGETSSTKSVSKSSGAQSISSRTYDSASNNWVGNGVTSFSSNGSQSNGGSKGAYELTQEKSAIGWVPVATKVEPVRVAAAAASAGPGGGGVLGGKASSAAAAKSVATSGPGAPVPVKSQQPFRLGEIVVTAPKPTSTGAGPGNTGAATGVKNTPAAVVVPRKGGNLGFETGVFGPAPDTGFKDKNSGFNFGIRWESNPWFTNVEDGAEARYGDFGGSAVGLGVLGADIIYNVGRAANALPLSPQTPVIGAEALSDTFAKPTPNADPYGGGRFGGGFQRPW